MESRLTRLVWLGAHFGVAPDAVVLAPPKRTKGASFPLATLRSVMSSQDAFAMPSPLFMREEKDFVHRLRAAASARLLFDGGARD